jgi:hypothetical protein
VSKRFAALHDFDHADDGDDDDDVDINRTWETIRENINISAKRV